MNYGRRRFLATGLALRAAGALNGQTAEPFTLEFPDMPLGETGAVDIAVATTAPCTMDLRLIGSPGQTILELPQWTMELKNAESTVNKHVNGSTGASVTVRASIRPRGSSRPHIAGVVRSSHGSNRSELERSAERVAFQKDPDPRPQPGSFRVTLAADSKLTLRIWENRPSLGTPIYERTFGHVSREQPIIPWDLRTNAGSIAPSGEYVATLAATPTGGRDATLFFSSFQLL